MRRAGHTAWRRHRAACRPFGVIFRKLRRGGQRHLQVSNRERNSATYMHEWQGVVSRRLCLWRFVRLRFFLLLRVMCKYLHVSAVDPTILSEMSYGGSRDRKRNWVLYWHGMSSYWTRSGWVTKSKASLNCHFCTLWPRFRARNPLWPSSLWMIPCQYKTQPRFRSRLP